MSSLTKEQIEGFRVVLQNWTSRDSSVVQERWQSLCNMAEAYRSSLEAAPEPVGPPTDYGVDNPRFFIDHGMIHDRLTGRHVHGDRDLEPGVADEAVFTLNELHASALREISRAAAPVTRVPEAQEPPLEDNHWIMEARKTLDRLASFLQRIKAPWAVHWREWIDNAEKMLVAQEPVAKVTFAYGLTNVIDTPLAPGTKLYAAPVPLPSPPSEGK